LLKVRRAVATFPPAGGNLRRVNPLPKMKSAGRAAVSKPRDAGKALAGGFRWAGGGIASQTKSAGSAISGKTKRARDAVAAKSAPARSRVTGLWAQAKEKFQTNPQLGIAAILGALLVIAWIGWAIYVTSTNGANAGLGVVISWPAVFMAVALVMAPFVGVYLLVRRLNGGDEDPPQIAGGAPDDDDTSATAGTYPG
jgi:hypothetical protein